MRKKANGMQTKRHPVRLMIWKLVIIQKSGNIQKTGADKAGLSFQEEQPSQARSLTEMFALFRFQSADFALMLKQMQREGLKNELLPSLSGDDFVDFLLHLDNGLLDR